MNRRIVRLLVVLGSLLFAPNCSSPRKYNYNSQTPFYQDDVWREWLVVHNNPDTLFAIRSPVYEHEYSGIIITAFRNNGEWFGMKALEYSDGLRLDSLTYLPIGSEYIDDNLAGFVDEISTEFQEEMAGSHMEVYCVIDNKVYENPFFQIGSGHINSALGFKNSLVFIFFSIVNNS